MSYDDNGISDLGYTPEFASYEDFANTGYTPTNINDYIPEATDPRGWFTAEEALAGPEASFKDIKASYPEAFKDSSGIGSLIAKLGGNLLGVGKQVGQNLLDKTGSASGLSDIARALLAIYAYKNKDKFGTAPGSQLDTSKIDTGMTVSRAPRAVAAYEPYSGKAVMGQQYFDTKFSPKAAATGGIMELARGGSTRRAPRYLDGPTDGMADKINTSIDDRQPAKLSHGEFVIPADVVSHLGNGNSSAGAKVLYNMMDKVRKARTGNKKQGKQINPAKFTPGGVAAYAGGGAVAFADGGTAETAVSGLAPWAGTYVTDQLSRASALAKSPYEAYTGPLTAGASPLQTQGFAATSNLQGYQPTSFGNQFNAPTAYQTGQFDTGLGAVKSVGEYMSPYMQNVVDVQSTEARRQADIDRIANMQRMTRAGGYGGSRQAIMESEGQRNLQTQLGTIQATGLQSAYDRALEQRLKESDASMGAQKATEESRQYGYGKGLASAELAAKYGLEGQRAGEESKQFGAKYDMDAAKAMLDAGGTQRTIEQQGIEARKAQWEKERADPYEKTKWALGLLGNMPISASTEGSSTSGYSDLLGLINALGVAGKP